MLRYYELIKRSQNILERFNYRQTLLRETDAKAGRPRSRAGATNEVSNTQMS